MLLDFSADLRDFAGLPFSTLYLRGLAAVQSKHLPEQAHVEPAAEFHPAEDATAEKSPLLLSILASNYSTADATSSRADAATERLKDFVNESRPSELLRQWLGSVPQDTKQLQDARRHLVRDIARIDQLLSGQVNQILHHPLFQRLEASWRGLEYLWRSKRELAAGRSLSETGGEIEIRVLDISKKELHRDLENAIEFDQSQLFKKVYEEEFGMPGGRPYGLLVADFEFTNHPDDIDMLGRLSGVGAAAFAPIIAAASPALMGMDDFRTLEQPFDLQGIFRGAKYTRWQTLRASLDAKFLGLTAPRILMRSPYLDTGANRYGFRFLESPGGSNGDSFLWGSAAWAFAAVVCRAFAVSSWFGDIRGVQRGIEGGGLVTGLPTHAFRTDAAGVALRSSVEVQISEAREAELSRLGFIPLSHCRDTPYSVFYANPSVHQPQVYSDEVATANASVSSMLQYVLCCSRIAHYLKVKVRDRVGSQATPRQIEDELTSWIHSYVTPDDRATPEMKARYPLRDASIEVDELPGRPGEFRLTMRLLPHYQLDQLTSSISFVAHRVHVGV